MRLKLLLLFVTCNILASKADISHVLAGGNHVEGYDYPKPKIAFPLPTKATEPPAVYLPPETTARTTTTTTTTTPRPKPPTPKIVVEESKEGYDYPKPKIAFPLPKPTIKTVVKSPPEVTYLPPTPADEYLPPVTTTARTTTTTTTRRTTTTARVTQPKPTPTERTVFKEETEKGYDYPTPQVRLTLPPKVTQPPVKITPKPTPPVEYLPPVTTTERRTTPSTTRPTTPRATPPPTRPTERTVIKQDSKEGYDYPKPLKQLELPSPKPKILVTVKPDVTYLPPTVPDTYLPPVVTTARTTVTTTTRPTTVRVTQPKPTPTLKTIIKEDTEKGYDYPTPQVRLTLPPKVTQPPIRVTPQTPVAEYLPPVTTTERRTTTTTTTRPRTTTTRATTPQAKIFIEEEAEKGYDYPKPKNQLTFPPKEIVKPTPPVEYLPPVTTTERRTTQTTTRTTTRAPPPPTERTVIKQDEEKGYDYPTPQVRLTLPPKVTQPPIKVTVKPTPPAEYLPPTVADTYLPPVITTQRTTVTTTTRPTTVRVTQPKPTPTLRTIIKEDTEKGYDYPKPEVRLTFPPKETVKPTPPVEYLPPVTTTERRTTPTTTRATTTRATPPPTRPTERTVIKQDSKEGYDYPKPLKQLELPSPKPKILVTVKPDVTYLPPTVADTYLPPVVTTARTTVTTTTRPTTVRVTQPKPTPTLRTIIKEDTEKGYDYPKPEVRLTFPPKETVKPTPPVEYLPPVTTTERRTTPTTPRATTPRATQPPTRPTERTVIKQDSKEGYDYPKPEVRLTLPPIRVTQTPPPVRPPPIRATFKPEVTYLPPTVPDTYLPPVVTTQRTTVTTTTTRRPTPPPTRATTPEARIFKEDEAEKGYDYPKPEVRLTFPPKVTQPPVKITPKPTPPVEYLPPVTTTERRTTTTTTTTPRPTERTIFEETVEEHKGYDYPKPKVQLQYPSRF